MHRILSLVYLLPISALTVFCFIGYANVVDTMSMKMGASVIYQAAFWFASGGIVSLLIGLAFRLFAARWIIIVSLLVCAGFTIFSLVTYPVSDDAHDGPALSHSPGELAIMLAATSLLLLLVILEPRIRSCIHSFVRQIRRRT
jgi:hypothetical protein